ncbi:MAG: hypothetical protein KF901_22480 [Myxococcales bacterium]|nr:hypothetical protein [Myxococcales bacterium]
MEASGQERAPLGGPLTLELFGTAGQDRPGLTGADEHDVATQDIGILTGEGRVGGFRATSATSSVPLLTSVRHGVGIDRKTGSAYPTLHYQREVAGGDGDVLEAEIEVSASDEALRLLRDAIALVSGLGNSQSRGLGRVELDWIDPSPENKPANKARLTLADGTETTLAVELAAIEPLLLGGFPAAGNVRESMEYVPGSALRGALAAAAVRSGLDADAPEFHAVFVDSATCISFSDLAPTPRPDKDLPLPAPRSRLTCKHEDDTTHEGRDVARDVLVSSWLVGLALQRGGTVAPLKCSVCGRPLTAARGYVPRVESPRRVVTRLGRDVGTGSVLPGLLYSTVQIEPGARFRGTVTRVDERARALLRRIDAPVRVGGQRNRGLGTVSLTMGATSALDSNAVKYRLERFERHAARALDAMRRAGFDALPQRLLPIVARTDLMVPPEHAVRELSAAIFGDRPNEILAVHQSASVRSGWTDLEGGPRPLVPVVAAGSAWLFGFAGDPPSHELLAGLEAEGLGKDRELGLGRLIFAPRALTEGWT